MVWWPLSSLQEALVPRWWSGAQRGVGTTGAGCPARESGERAAAVRASVCTVSCARLGKALYPLNHPAPPGGTSSPHSRPRKRAWGRAACPLSVSGRIGLHGPGSANSSHRLRPRLELETGCWQGCGGRSPWRVDGRPVPVSSLDVLLAVCVLISSHEDAGQVGRGPAHETASNLGRLCRPPPAAAACLVPARCRRLGVEGTQVSTEPG